ncbi:MAG: hypothetical protein HY290_11170 [Planctomycetia bacterium]|nr:hypothetical protein [Planctomycetia bacterium]
MMYWWVLAAACLGDAAQTHPLSVSGSARDPNGKPIAGATIFIVSTYGTHKVLGKATTDGAGAYSFQDLPLPIPVNESYGVKDHGYFQVFGRAPGHSFAWLRMTTMCLDLSRREHRKPDQRLFFPDEKIEQNLVFDRPYRITGRCVDERGRPIAGVKLTLTNCLRIGAKPTDVQYYADLREFEWLQHHAAELIPEDVVATSDASGSFRFDSVPADKVFWLAIQHPDFMLIRSIYTVEMLTQTMTVATSANPSRVETPWGRFQPVPSPADITLRSVRRIMVRAVWADTNQPAAGLELQTEDVHPPKGLGWGGVTDAEGKTVLRRPPGRYPLIVSPPLQSPYLRTTHEFNVDDQPREQALDLKITRGCDLVLRALDSETGKTIGGMTFLYVRDGANEKTSEGDRSAQIPYAQFFDAHRELHMTVPPGPARVRIDLGTRPDWRAADSADQSAGRPVELSAGDTQVVEFKLVRQPNDFIRDSEEPPSIEGQVLFDGAPPAQRTIQPRRGPPIADESLIVDQETKGIANVAIYLAKVPAGVPVPRAPKGWRPIEITERGFVPRVSVVRTGLPMIVTNNDSEAANVHTMPVRNQPFNQVVPLGGAVVLNHTKPENVPIPVQSDFQNWMKAYEVILDHPWAAVTDASGKFTIKGLPPGAYEFRVWHELTGFLDRKLNVEVKAGEATRVELVYPLQKFVK